MSLQLNGRRAGSGVGMVQMITYHVHPDGTVTRASAFKLGDGGNHYLPVVLPEETVPSGSGRAAEQATEQQPLRGSVLRVPTPLQSTHRKISTPKPFGNRKQGLRRETPTPITRPLPLGPSKVVLSEQRARHRALASGKGYCGPAEPITDEMSSEITNYWRERRLDGSRDFWQIRDNGEFGSYPLYDDCSDESAP